MKISTQKILTDLIAYSKCTLLIIAIPWIIVIAIGAVLLDTLLTRRTPHCG